MTGARVDEEPLNIRAVVYLGLDGEPGETRITRGENFLLYGGSRYTHKHMVETALRFNEKVDKRGKPLSEINAREFSEITRELMDER